MVAAARSPISELRLVATARLGAAPRLDEVSSEPAPSDPALDELVALGASASGAGLWIVGGEPTLRDDLPALVTALRQARGGERPGLVSDGQVLSVPRAVAALRDAGLGPVRIALHAARVEAHDWLTGRDGSGHRAVRALRECAAHDLPTEIAATVTRVTAPHLAELVELAARVHVRAVHLRRLVRRGPAVEDDVALLPRVGLTEPELERAVLTGRRLGVDVSLEGFPPCATGEARSACRPSDAISWLVASGVGWQAVRAGLEPPAATGRCGVCPGPPACAGAPSDYLARFGPAEFLSEHEAPTPLVSVEDASEIRERLARAPVPPPRARAGHAPATRVRAVAARAQGSAHAGERAAETPSRLCVTWSAPARVACPDCAAPSSSAPEPVRDVKLRLVRAAQQGARSLRLAGAALLEHPAALDLFKDVAMLSFDRVEVACEGSRLDELSDSQLRALAKISRLDIALHGPNAELHDTHVGHAGAFAATLRGIARLTDGTGVPTGAFGVLHDADEIGAYADAWANHDLPGTPAFRLSARGGSLALLARNAAALREGPARVALAALVPPCLLARGDGVAPAPDAGAVFDDGLRHDAPVAGCDRLGRFAPCRCGTIMQRDCPGIALGWRMPNPAE